MVGLLEDSGVPDGELEDGGVPPGAPVDGGVVGVPGLVILSPEPDFGVVDLSASRLQPAAASVKVAAATSVSACLIMSASFEMGYCYRPRYRVCVPAPTRSD